MGDIKNFKSLTIFDIVQADVVIVAEDLKQGYPFEDIQIGLLGSENLSENMPGFLLMRGKVWLVLQNIRFGRLPSLLELDLKVVTS